MKSDYQILIVDDDDSIRQLLSLVLAREGFQTASAENGEEALAVFQRAAPDIVLMDIRMPGINGIEAMRQMLALRPNTAVILMSAYADLDTALQAIKNGVFDFIIKPFDLAEIGLLVNRAFQMREMRREIRFLRHELSENFRADRIITADPVMKSLCESVQRIAANTASVVLYGESGVGKELLASALHYSGPRAQKPFVKVNCGAIPEGLLESEFFGHEKGAFTGAIAQRTGRFEYANGGTLFLDEISELPLALQVKLLRVLQDRQFERVGGEKTLHTDIRLVVASNRKLEDMVEEGRFRKDLYYRLNVVNLHVPPLRERPADIPLLSAYFLSKFALEHQRDVAAFDEQALSILEAYAWPGNVRELANAVECAVVMSTGNTLFAEDLPASVRQARAAENKPKTLKALVRDFERKIIQQTLEHCQGNRSHAANHLNISRRALLYKLHELNMESEGAE